MIIDTRNFLMSSKELIEKAQECETPEQLIELAKTEDIELTKEEAEAYLAQLQDVELDSENLEKVAGGCGRKGWWMGGDCASQSASCWAKNEGC